MPDFFGKLFELVWFKYVIQSILGIPLNQQFAIEHSETLAMSEW